MNHIINSELLNKNFVENEYTKNLYNLIINNQNPFTTPHNNLSYYMVAKIYHKLTEPFIKQYPDILNALIHSDITDSLIDIYDELDLYPTYNVLIYDPNYKTVTFIDDPESIDLYNKPFKTYIFLNSTFELYINK